MKDFIFRNDTKLLFRNDIRTAIAEIAKGHKVMFVYGGGSVKRNGCHDDIVQTLADNGIPLVEYGDSSREFAKIEEGKVKVTFNSPFSKRSDNLIGQYDGEQYPHGYFSKTCRSQPCEESEQDGFQQDRRK
jgi:hypothetical protein